MEEECSVCGSTVDLILGPDPFYSKTLGDDSDVWMCRFCLELSSEDLDLE